MRIGPRSSFAIIAIAAPLLGLVLWLGPGITLEAWWAILPEWAISAQVGHTISSLSAPSEVIEQARLRNTIDGFIISHNMKYVDLPSNTGYPSPDILKARLWFENTRYALSYRGDEEIRLSLDSQPGKNGNHDAIKQEFLAAFGPLGFVEQPASPD